mgnify:CR=1 FL=1
MFFADEPYISDFFRTTLRDESIPVAATPAAGNMELLEGTRIIDETEAVKILRGQKYPLVYSTSENAIEWMSANLGFTELPGRIDLFKNKVKFRKMTEKIFPGFFYRPVLFSDLGWLKLDDLPFPFIIKPAVGFFSMGVHLVTSPAEWPGIVDAINREMAEVKHLYPARVLDAETFIIEQCITGEEFAVDAYYNAEGEAVVLNIMKHSFSSDSDVSDRVYTTSKKIIEANIDEFTVFLEKIGAAAGVKNFPVHAELRRGEGGLLLPIEVNPLRFGGWCTTADIAFHAYGFNPYVYYYRQKKPDWPELLKNREGRNFSIIVLDNSTGITGGDIVSFDYDKLLEHFSKPLELRKIDFTKYPVFGFLFTEAADAEIEYILNSDLSEFI